jgi:WD40 repeat protein
MLRIISIFIIFVYTSFSLYAQQLSIQTGHASAILDLEFSPDGKILASCGADNKIVLWDMISSKQMNILSGHNGIVNSISINPTKNIIASASDDGTVKIWRYPSGELLKTYDFFKEKVKSVGFSPNGENLACGSNYIYIIDINTDKSEKLSQQAKKTFNSLAYSKDSKYLAFGEKAYKKNYIYNLSSKTIEKKIKIKSNEIIFSEDGSFIYVAGEKGILLKKRIKKEKKSKEHEFKQLSNYTWNSFNSAILFKNYLIAANKDNLIYIYNKKTGKRLEILKAHNDEVRALAVNTKGNYIASAGKDRKIILWNIDERKIIKTLEGGAISTNSISFTNDGNSMFIAYADGSFKTWDLASKTNINYAKFDEGIKQRFYTVEKDYSTQSTSNPLYKEKILIKVDRIKLDKYSDEIAAEYENIALWKTNNSEKIKRKINKKSSDYKNYFLVDTANIISVRTNATRSQKYSLLNHLKIREKEEVFSIIVNSCKLEENKKELKIKKVKSFKIKGNIYYKTISSNGDLLLILKSNKEKSIAEVWDIKLQKKINTKEFNTKVKQFDISNKNKYITIINNEGVLILNYDDFKQVARVNGTAPIIFSNDDKYLAYTNAEKELILFDVENKQTKFQIKTHHQTKISDIKFNDKYNFIATSSYDGLIKFWEFNTGKLLTSMAVFKDNDFIYISPENYYFSTKQAMNYIGFLFKDKLYSFEQFDLKYNRPDIVFAKIGYSNKSELKALNKAYLKRIKKLGFNKDAFESDFNIPSLSIQNINKIPIETKDNFIDLKLNLSDSLYKIDRLNIWINNVAVYGTNGINLKEKAAKQIKKDIKLKLAQGKNKIEISCLNQKGAESYKETIELAYKPKEIIKPNLYLITIGTSKYQDNRFDLQYAAKDAQDIVNLYNKNTYFNMTITKTITNEQVTKENIEKLKDFLSDATINDQVIIFVAGHGILDAELDYYLASYPMDFNKPEGKGIPYENIEMLLDGIKPLKKILFVDACHSGEIDKDEMELAIAENTEQGDVVFRAAGTNVVSKEAGKSTSELSKELFTDLRRGTGATVVSSAGGGEFAMESGEWKNGLFTYCLINGIQSKEADLNKDGEIMLSELQKYVQSKVFELSAGKQKPTSRIENISFDFRVW